MKKSTIVVVFGFFIVITAFLSMNNEKMYKKQKHFETVNEVLEQLDNRPLNLYDEKYDYNATNELNECVSERKRMTGIRLDYGKMEILKVEELNDNEKQEILKDYNIRRNEFSKRREITKEEPARIDAKVWYSHIENGKRVYSNPRKINFDFVFVDEGEGLVIDYLIEQHNVKLDNEEVNEDA
jgi:hypothetical protein